MKLRTILRPIAYQAARFLSITPLDSFPTPILSVSLTARLDSQNRITERVLQKGNLGFQRATPYAVGIFSQPFDTK